jgi:hypothetical protein
MVEKDGRDGKEPGHAPKRRGAAVFLVSAGIIGIVVGLGVSVALVAGLASAVHSAGGQLASTTAPLPGGSGAVTESMEILTNNPFGPQYTNTHLTVRAGETVTLRITSYDNGTAPLSGAEKMFDRVSGTIGGTETAGGTPVRSVANDDLAHTFTVPALGLNMPIPAAATLGGSVTVVARFVARRVGTFVWQCYAPCGSGANSMGGPMSTMGWMEGTIRVLA